MTMSQETVRLGAHETLRVVAHEPDALALEATWTPGGSAPIGHLHPEQDEAFEVLAGLGIGTPEPAPADELMVAVAEYSDVFIPLLDG
jgi:hypothetical protein